MKFGKYIIIGIILFLGFIIYKINFVDCPGCGGCTYEKFEDQVFVKTTKWENDSIIEVTLKSVTDTTQSTFYLDNWEITQRFQHLDPILFKNKKQKFLIEGEIATSGACVPYVIQKLELVKN